MRPMRAVIALAATALVLGALHVAARPATAQAQAETEVINVDRCETFGTTEFCNQAVAVIHTTQTPSGYLSSTINNRQCTRYTDTTTGQVIYQACNESHEHALFKDGELPVYHFTDKGTFTFLGQTCHYTIRIQYANGVTRYEEFTFQCA